MSLECVVLFFIAWEYLVVHILTVTYGTFSSSCDYIIMWRMAWEKNVVIIPLTFRTGLTV